MTYTVIVQANNYFIFLPDHHREGGFPKRTQINKSKVRSDKMIVQLT